MASAKRLVKIDVVSDNICPWCFVGKRRLEKAIAQARQKNLPLDFQVNFKPFQLDATLPVEGKDKLAHYKSKFGAARMDQMIPFMEGIGKKEGITFSYGGVIANTINSHRLVALAEKKGLQDQTVEELFKTYFEKNDNIGDLNVLADVGAKVGLDKEEVLTYLKTEEGRQEVEKDIETAYRRRITGVPHFIIDQTYSLGGAQEPEVFLEVFSSIAGGDSQPDI